MADKEEPHINIAGFDLNQREVQALGAAAVAASFAAKQRREALARAEAARQAEIARQDAIRKEEHRREEEKEARQRQDFDNQNDPCPYCQSQIPKTAAICPNCRNGFFGFPWDLIHEAVIASPTVVDGLTSEKLSTAVEQVKPAYEARLAREQQQRVEAEKVAKQQAQERALAEEKRRAETEKQNLIAQEHAEEASRKNKKILAIVLGLIGLIYLGSKIFVAVFPPTPATDIFANGVIWNENSTRVLPYGSKFQVVIRTPSYGNKTLNLEGSSCRITGYFISARESAGSCKLRVEISKSTNPSFAATQLVRTLALTNAKPKPPKLFKTVRIGTHSKPLPSRTRIGAKSVKWKWKSATPGHCIVKNSVVVGKLPGYCKLIASTPGVKNYVAANNRTFRIVKILKP